MIPYIEILKWNDSKDALESFYLVEPSQCWFELSYYEKGEFEIYVAANLNNLNALQKGYFARIPNKPYLWIITSIQYEYNAEGSRMIDVKGYEAKLIVGKRIIKNPLQLPSNLNGALTFLFDSNIGTKVDDPKRIIEGLEYDFSLLDEKETEAQATRGNLLDFTLNLLKLHKSGLVSYYQNNKVYVKAIVGEDKSESVLFAQSMDNLINATYYSSDDNFKNHVQIVSTFSETTGTGAARTTTTDEYVAYYPDENEPEGIDRNELYLESNISTKVQYEDSEGHIIEEEIDPSSNTYKLMQQSEGAAKLAEHTIVTDFNGEIDLQNSQYEFEKDFFIGDLVKVRDEYFGYEAIARITKYTFKQDESGYGEEAEYGD